jgi:protein-tyrosine phosphatase
MNTQKELSVLFVCLGNICRSPTAEGVFTRLLQREGLRDRVHVDSAGTHAYHVGKRPDERACAAALRRGIVLDALRARAVALDDFERFDYVLAMDRQNLLDLQTMCPTGREDRLRLFLEFGRQSRIREVPDPYYGGAHGFDRVLDLIEDAASGLLAEIQARLECAPAGRAGQRR